MPTVKITWHATGIVNFMVVIRNEETGAEWQDDARTGHYLNNRAENSHRPSRRRERQMQRFKSPPHAQRFLSSHAMIYGYFRPRRHLMTAGQYRRARAEAFQVWRQETCVQLAA